VFFCYLIGDRSSTGGNKEWFSSFQVVANCYVLFKDG